MTETDICNMALRRIGAATVLSAATVYDGTDGREAAVVSETYPVIRDQVLRSHPWNFATRRAVLEPDATAPAFGYANRYALPDDNLRVLSVNDDDKGKSWTLEGGWLLTDADPAQVRYVGTASDPASFEPLFTRALVALLAAEISVPLTRGTDMKTALLQEYETITAPLARRVDSNESRERDENPYLSSDLVASRFG